MRFQCWLWVRLLMRLHFLLERQLERVGCSAMPDAPCHSYTSALQEWQESIIPYKHLLGTAAMLWRLGALMYGDAATVQPFKPVRI